MPTYDYHCESCEHTFEIFHGMSKKPSITCPKCGKRRVRRLVGSAALIFKGSGFYITDYKNKPAKAERSAPPAVAKPSGESGTKGKTSIAPSSADKKK